MLCWFLLHSRMNQLYIYIYPLFFRFFSHIGHYTVLSRAPCAIQKVLIIYFIYSSVYMGEGNGTLLQYSCQENPMDGGTW